MPTPNKKKVMGSRRSTGIRRRTSLRGYQYCPPLDRAIENEKMMAAEREQTKEDKFWGLDLQAANCAREGMLMSFEDFFSRNYEQYYQTLAKQKRWKEEFSRMQYESAYNQALQEQDNRKRYMKQLFSSTTSEQIVFYRWNKYDVSSSIGSDQPPLLAESSSNILSLPPTDIGARSISLHLDGLQQSRALNKGDPHNFHGPSLRNRNIQSVVEESLVATSITGKGKTSDGRKSPSAAMRNKAGILRSNAPEIGFLSTEELLHAMEAPSSKPLTLTDGHPTYKWDQEVILKLVFRKLDARRRGFLSLEDIALLPQTTSLHELLLYTVFGAWIKKRQWKKFANLCDTAESSIPSKTWARPDPSSPEREITSRAQAQPPKTMSLQQWILAAHKLSREYGVARSYIRTDIEHQQIAAQTLDCCQPSVQAPPLSHLREMAGKTAVWFATRSRTALGHLERQSTLARDVREGDVVWALHGKGVMWLPAIVERVVFSDLPLGRGFASARPLPSPGKAAGKRRAHDRVSYELSYFMSFDALQSARALESCRKLLELPSKKSLSSADSLLIDDSSSIDSQVAIGASTSTLASGKVSAKKPVITERMLCEGLFEEMCRKSSAVEPSEASESPRLMGGVRLDTSFVQNTLLQDAFATLAIKSSAALTALFAVVGDSADSTTLESNQPVLIRGLLNAFPRNVSKVEFVEYCMAALDLSVFRSALLR